MGAKTFAYNQNNRLISASENGSTLGEYTYNAFGQRTIKKAGGKTTIFHYDRLGNIISEETQGEELIRDYIYIGRTRIAMVESRRCLADIDTDHDVDGADLALLADDYNRTDCSETSPCRGDVNGDGVVNTDDLNVFASEFGKTSCPEDKFYYFHNDHLGTPQLITDQNGTIVWSANYKPFGEATITTKTISNPFRFPGQYYDNETGLHCNYFRYYDPGIGRYLRVDPSHSVQPRGSGIPYLLPSLFDTSLELNPYHYATNNPVNGIDPVGLLSCNGTWRQMGSDRIAMWYCLCYWLCVPCDAPVIWSGNYRSLTSTRGQYIYQGGEGLERGDRCLCKKPGPDRECGECEREAVSPAEDWWEGGKW